MTPDLLRTLRWLLVCAAVAVVALGFRPQIHVYLHHDVTFPQLPDLPARR